MAMENEPTLVQVVKKIQDCLIRCGLLYFFMLNKCYTVHLAVFTRVVITSPMSVQEAAGWAGGSSHAERATEGLTTTCTTQQPWWPGSCAGGSLLCPGERRQFPHQCVCLSAFTSLSKIRNGHRLCQFASKLKSFQFCNDFLERDVLELRWHRLSERGRNTAS